MTWRHKEHRNRVFDLFIPDYPGVITIKAEVYLYTEVSFWG